MSEQDQLRAALRTLYEDLRADVQARWQRDLPLEELLFDRWERAASLGFGEGTSIYHSSYVFGDVSVGRNTWIGPLVLLDGTGGLRIGDNCSVSTGVQIYSHDTVKWAVSGGSAPYEHAPVSIGSSCYIGSHSVVAKGVTIGDHCVVGACSFVNRDLAPNTIAGGVPIRHLGHVEVHDGDAELVIDREQA
jgi:acetyltransferase-like isoleucine patch superfamily enzyme